MIKSKRGETKMELKERCNFILMREYDVLDKSLWNMRANLSTKRASRGIHDSLEQGEFTINMLMSDIHDVLFSRVGKDLDVYFDAQHKYLQTLSEEQKNELVNAEKEYLKSDGKNDSLKRFLDKTEYIKFNKILAKKHSGKEL